MRAAARPLPLPEPPPHALVYPRSPTSISITKLGIPLTVAIGIMCSIAAFMYGAGGKVSGNERDVAYLTSRVDANVAGLVEARTRAQIDHDEITKMQVEIASLKEEEAGKNITISMDDKKDKK